MRDNNIDLLRFVGLSLIILAHVSPPPIIFNIRTLDVPLMVFISGLTCYGKDIQYSWGYLSHRFARLVFPVWIFLTIYFTPIILLKVLGIDLGLNFRLVWRSYLLLDGIGYVWIIRVFLLIALLTPLLIRINNIVKKQYVYIVAFSICLCCYLFVTSCHIGTDINIVNNWLYYAIGYGFLFMLGVRIKGLTKTEGFRFFSIMVLIFIAQSIVDVQQMEWNTPLILHINDFKYPPTNVFLLYGLIMSTVTYAVVYLKRRDRLHSLIHFVGCNSIWIYLWHIPIVTITAKLDIAWWLRFIIVYSGALAIYYMQLSVLKVIEKKKEYRIFKYLKG